MNYNEFENILIGMGFTNEQVCKLNELGYESALDAHAGMEEELGGVDMFEDFCWHMGRSFVIDNLDLFEDRI